MAARWSDVKQYVRARDNQEDSAAAWLVDDDDRERHASVVRNCVCGMLCVLAVVAVSALLGSALFGASSSSSHMKLVLHHVKQAGVVEFTVAIKSERSSEALEEQLRQHKVKLKRRRRKKETTEVLSTDRQQELYDPSVVKVSGSLIPRTSEDSGRLRFDGWIQIETNASQVHELVLANHRGYRTIRELPSMKTVSEGCLSTEGIPPLHALEAIPPSAFRAEEFSAFGVNCTVGRPIEMLFMSVPFVFCADEAIAQQDLAAPTLLALEEADTVPKTLAFHGERVMIQANLVGAKPASNSSSNTGNRTLSALERGGSGSGSEAEEVQLEATTTMWRKKAKSVPASCPYLEAPLTSGREKKSFLYHLLPAR